MWSHFWLKKYTLTVEVTVYYMFLNKDCIYLEYLKLYIMYSKLLSVLGTGEDEKIWDAYDLLVTRQLIRG